MFVYLVRGLIVATCLLLATSASAKPGAWKQVGDDGAWKATIAGTSHGDALLTVESSGALYTTDLSSGKWKQLGKSEFGNTKFMFATGSDLYTIEKDGSLYRVSAKDGSWKQVGSAGAWKATIAGTIHDGALYTVEDSGALYVTDLSTGKWKQLGKSEFGNTKFMFAAGGDLYTIETSGSLYRVSAKDGSWKQVGSAGAWKATIAGTVLGGALYTVESSGALYVTDLSTGKWTQLGGNDFGSTRFLFAANSRLYSIETSGSLYAIEVE